MAMKRLVTGLLVASIAVAILSTRAYAQSYGTRLGERRGGEITFEPKGSGVLYDALDPTVKRWYIPQELYQEYRW